MQHILNHTLGLIQRHGWLTVAEGTSRILWDAVSSYRTWVLRFLLRSSSYGLQKGHVLLTPFYPGERGEGVAFLRSGPAGWAGPAGLAGWPGWPAQPTTKATEIERSEMWFFEKGLPDQTLLSEINIKGATPPT